MLITDAVAPNGKYKNGDLFQAVRKWGNGINVGKPFDMFDSEYEVLDGYTPEPEKEPEPVYYSGKVVCINEGDIVSLTAGKVYEVKDGYFTNDIGHKNPRTTGALKSIEDMNSRHKAKFIPFLGE